MSDYEVIVTCAATGASLSPSMSKYLPVTPEQIVFIETYKLGDEVVKQSSHVKLLIGAAAVGEASI